MDYSILHNDLYNGPYAVQLAPMISAGQDAAIAAFYNEKPAAQGGTEAADPITGAQFLAALNPAELNNLTGLELQQIGLYTAADQVSIGDEALQAWITSIWTQEASPLTHARLTGMATQAASRAELLYGPGTVLTDYDVSQSRG